MALADQESRTYRRNRVDGAPEVDANAAIRRQPTARLEQISSRVASALARARNGTALVLSGAGQGQAAVGAIR